MNESTSKYYKVYTDGAYSFTRKQGGCAFIILDKDNNELARFAKGYKNCTNNTMEMMACIIALESIKVPSIVLILSDSMYVVGTYTQNWRRNKNLELWERFDKAIAKHIHVHFKHTKGHASDMYNNLCDKLAVEKSQQ